MSFEYSVPCHGLRDYVATYLVCSFSGPLRLAPGGRHISVEYAIPTWNQTPASGLCLLHLTLALPSIL